MIALCLGGALNVWRDLERAEAMLGGRDRLIIACNDTGVLYPGKLDAWATLHPEHLNAWRERREAGGFDMEFRAVFHARTPGVAGEVVAHGWYGSSGLYMAQVALEHFGAGAAILCGVPQDAEAGHVRGLTTWPHTDRYRPGFLKAKADGANVRSMSGWTAQVLGEPDADWVNTH